MALRWEEERYVRIYTRDTVTWKLLPWQSKCLLPVLIRKMDRGGFAEIGPNAEEGISALTDIPAEFITEALPALLKRGVFVINGETLFMPKFVEAQETRQSEKFRKSEQRSKAREITNDVSRHVPSCPDVSASVPPSRAVPCLAVPSQASLEAAPKQETKKPAPQAEPEPDLRDRLEAVFLKSKSVAYSWDQSRDDAAIRALLGKGDWDEICRRWRIALARGVYPTCASLPELLRHWNHYATEQAAQPRRPGDAPPPGQLREGTVRLKPAGGEK